MNREIKFRAWDIGKWTGKRQMLNWSDLDEWDKNGICHLVDLCNGIEEGMVLMQYTGLKDKKGKEIYEGDVVEVDSQSKAKGVIEWFGSGFELGGEELCLNGKAYRVLGNIYENPELLNIPIKGE